MRSKIMPMMLLSAIISPPASDAQMNETASAGSRADAVLGESKNLGIQVAPWGVYQNGNTLYEGAYGLANLEHGVPIDPQRTVFDTGSVSKQFTAASILLLAQDGKLKLDDDIRKYLPEIPDYGHTITIDHLLHHTSGLRDHTVLRWMMGKSFLDYAVEQDGLNLISQQKALNHIPGDKYSYSNTGYFLASVIVERVGGKPLANFAKERIFSPLNMASTYFSDSPDRVTPHHASGYAIDEVNHTFKALRTGWSEYGHSGVQTTVADLRKWQHNFDDPKVGGAWLIEQLQQKGTLNSGQKIDYARGLMVHEDGYRGILTVLHGGDTPDGYSANLMRFPHERLSIAVLCNSLRADTRKLRDRLADIFAEGKFPSPAKDAATDRKPDPAPKKAVSINEAHSKLLGTYWNREDVTIRRIERKGGKLWYVRSPESRSELAPIEDGQLQMLGVSTRIVIKPMPPENGRQLVQVVTPTPATLEKVEPAATDAKTMSEYAGTYINSELNGARWSFAMKDGKLTVLPPPKELGELRPVFKDAFFDKDGELLLMFQRDASGRVASLVVDIDRLRNMTFIKAPE